MGSTLAISAPGFGEILALAVLALLIFGPERLPGMARNVGRALSQFRREASATLDELKATAELDELRGVADDLRSTGSELQRTGSELQRTAALAGGSAASARRSAPSATPSTAGDTPPPFDPDAT